MVIDYIFPRRICSSEKSSRVKILTEWKTVLTHIFFSIIQIVGEL